MLATATRNGPDGDAPGAVSATFTYDTDHTPASVHASVRERYGEDRWQSSWVYSDGGGAVVQTKVQAAPDADGTPRFVGTGRTVHNNKGLPVQQYEPFFSPTSGYEDDDAIVATGVTSIWDYDPVGRNTQVTLPDGHLRRWTYTPWQVSAYDEHDTDPSSPFHDTPETTHLDAQGRVFRSTETPDGVTEHVTHLTLDVQGNVLQVTDARGNATQVQTFDLVGRPLFTGAADEGYDGVSGRGETRILVDVAGQPLRVWRSGNLSLRTAYDALRRPVGTRVDEGAGERRSTRTVYGDALPEPPPFAKGRPVQVDDPAGRVTLGYDFRGRTVSQARQVLADITVDPDWDLTPALDLERFTVTTDYDALDRVTSQAAPDGSATTRAYDEAGRLVAVAVALRGADTATAFVDHIAYDARGQRLAITYGNGTATTYTYDPLRFWLTRLHTLRGSTALQDLQYTLDAAGNIVESRDDAQQTQFFANSQVTPTRTFTYDALYRLTRATGREKVDQRQTTAFYAEYAGATGAIPDAGDPALRQYTQSYRYDSVGNLLEMKHQQGLGGAVAWRRGYAYEEGNNQLVSTSAPGDDPDDPATHTDRYPYNERGAMTAMPHLPALVRDPQDQIRRADLDLAGSVAWYAYDAAGQRVRKRVDKGGVQEERIYVGGYEVWRKRTGSGLQEERQTLHVMDDQRRIAMVETLTMTNGSEVPNPSSRRRYQLGDHLGTATLEVDEIGAIIDYEEYHPHGTTAWYAEKAGIGVSGKRYRYTGHEKDDETGLYYHGARHMAAWLGRWTAADPIGTGGGINRFAYCRGNPIGRSDPTGKADDDALTFDIMEEWKVNTGTNQREWVSYGRTAPVTDLTSTTPINIYEPNRPDPGPNRDDWELVAANTWSGPPQFQVARYEGKLYQVDIDNMALIPYFASTKERADHPYVMALPGLASDIAFGGPSRAGEEVVTGFAFAGIGKAAGAAWSALRGMAGASAEASTVSFYTVQSADDAARLAGGGAPWPTAAERAHFGEGVYAWQTEEAAAQYQSRLTATGAADLQVVKIELEASRFERASILDMRGMSDDAAEAIMTKHSKLWSSTATELPYDPVNPELGAEVFLSKRLFQR
ncbi:MAG: RHS repeat-associated core domain-containing protein [Myxococcota bacterium]